MTTRTTRLRMPDGKLCHWCGPGWPCYSHRVELGDAAWTAALYEARMVALCAAIEALPHARPV